MTEITNTAVIASPIQTSLASSGAASVFPLVRAHMPELDAVRGVAILMVLFYHGF